MSMSAISTGLSGLRAAEARLDAVAANVANMSTVGTAPGASGSSPVYEPIDVVTFQSGGGGRPSGVGYGFVPDPTAYDMAYDPASPIADGKGMVAVPRIDPAEQMVNLAYAKAQFTASAKVVAAANSMERAAIDLLA